MTPFELFQAALEYSAQQDQDDYVDRQCEHNPTLRSEVKSLLRAHREAKDFLDEDPAKTHRVIETVQQLSHDVSAREAASSRAIQRIKELLGTPVNPDAIAAIDHYSLLNAIGVGGFGVVFRAMDEKLQRLVAVKMLTPHSESAASPCRRFLQEARSAAAVNHENVVRIHDVEESPIPYIVMEYVNGPTLHQYIQEVGPLEIDTLVSLSRQIASGLAAAHQCGFVHRDIKPGNILVEVGSELKIKLTDFGLAQTVEDVSLSSSSEQFVGTPLYASPEQARSLEIDARSDLFSLGSVMYQMACGQAPFRAKSTHDVLQRVLKDTPRPIREICPSVPDWFCQIVERLHAKNPEQRIQSASQLAKLLSDCEGDINKAPSTVERSPLMYPDQSASEEILSGKNATNAPVASVAQSKGNASKRFDRSASKTRPYLLSAVGVVLLCGTLAWLVNRNSSFVGTEPSPLSEKDVSNPANTESIPQVQPELTRLDLQGLPPWSLPVGAPPPLSIPSTTSEAKERQSQWADYLNQKPIATTSIGLDFALVPPGDFDKTFSRNRDGEIHPSMPTIRFRMTQPYRMATTEVTVAQFQAFVDETGYQTDAEKLGFACSREFILERELSWKKPGWQTRSAEPVTMVTEADADAFCRWLSQKENRRFRLPTEAEWSHACRAASQSRYVFGTDSSALEFAAWTFENGATGLNHVGILAANPLGLYDMLGNLWERTSDWMETHDMLPYLQRVNPRGVPLSNTLGGCFLEPRQVVHADVSVGNWSSPSATIGFRVMEEIESKEESSWESHSGVLAKGNPMSPRAITTHPAQIDGLVSWSLCLRGSHSSKPTAPAWNPKTKQWFVGGDEGNVSVLNQDGSFAEKILGPSSISEVKISNDGNWVVVKDSNSSITQHLYVWYWPDRKLKVILPVDRRFWDISQDNSKIVFSKLNRGAWNNWGVYELDLKTGVTRSLMIPRIVDTMAFTSRLDRIVCQTTVDQESFLETLEYPSLKLICSIPSHRITEIVVSPDGKQIAVLDPTGQAIRIRDLETLQETGVITAEVDEAIQALQWYQDNDRVLIVGAKASRVVRVSSGEEIFRLPGVGALPHPPKLCEAAGVIVASGLSTSGTNTFDAQSGHAVKEWRSLNMGLDSVPVVSDRDIHFLRGDQVRTIDLHGPEKKQDQPWYPAPWGTAPTSHTVFAANQEQLMQLDLRTNTQRMQPIDWLEDTRVESTTVDSPTVESIVPSNDGQFLACLLRGKEDQQKVVIVKTADGNRICELSLKEGTLAALEWSADSKRIAGLFHRGLIELVVWDSTTGQPFCTTNVPCPRWDRPISDDQLRYSQKENAILFALGNQLYRFELESQTWKAIATCRIPTMERAIWQSPDQTKLLISYGTRFHHIHDSATNQFLSEIQCPRSKVLWTEDASTLLFHQPNFATMIFDSKTSSHIGTIVPFVEDSHFLICSPEGNYHGSEGVESLIAYVVMHEDGSQRTYTAAEFAEKFGWRNNPKSVSLTPPSLR